MAALLCPSRLNLRPFTSQSKAPGPQRILSSSRPVRVCRAASHQQEADAAPSLKALLPAAAASLAAFVPAAWADESELALASQQVVASVQAEDAPQDLVVSILFGIVIALLSTVTIGVAYLSLKQFLDGRQEQEDRQSISSSLVVPGDKKAESKRAEPAINLRKVAAVKKDKTRGFGSASADLSTSKREF